MSVRVNVQRKGGLLVAALLGAGVIAACGDKVSPGLAASGSASAAGVASATAPVAAPVRVVRREGSNIVLGQGEKKLYVASEEHHAIFVLDLPLDSAKKPTPFELPGPPAQIVQMGDELLITVRNLPAESARAALLEIRGPFPPPISAPPERKKPFDKATPKPDPRRGTPAKPLDAQTVRQSQGGLLVRMKIDAEGALTETARITLAPDAWGLGVTADGKRAVVTSGFSNRVSVVDLDTNKLVIELETAREPRAVAISPDGKTAFVTHLVGADLTKLANLDATPSLSRVPFPAAPARTPPGKKLDASLAYSAAFSADGRTLFVPRHALGAAGTGAWWGAPTVDGLDVATEKPLAPFAETGSPKTWNAPEGKRRHATASWLGLPGQAPPPDDRLVQPRAMVRRPSKQSLLVASEGLDTVRELDARAQDPAMFPIATWDTGINYEHFNGYVTEGGAPSGLALSRDEDTLFVFARSTFDVVSIALTESTPQRLADVDWSITFKDANQTGRTYVRLADDPLPFDATAGRRMFYSARDSVLSGGLGCASCHPDGRDDGHVWAEGRFGEAPRFVGERAGVDLAHDALPFSSVPAETPPLAPRQTPMIAGRVRAPGPYGWLGKDKDLLERLIHGFILHRAPWNEAGTYTDPGGRVARVDMLADFAKTGLLPPPTHEEPLSERASRGKALFEGKAACSSCHVPQSEFTDRGVVPLKPLPARSGFMAEAGVALKTPTLRFVANTAPYLHDGSAATLEELITQNADRMGKTSTLSGTETADLIAYLRTL